VSFFCTRAFESNIGCTFYPFIVECIHTLFYRIDGLFLFGFFLLLFLSFFLFLSFSLKKCLSSFISYWHLWVCLALLIRLRLFNHETIFLIWICIICHLLFFVSSIITTLILNGEISLLWNIFDSWNTIQSFSEYFFKNS